MATVTLRPGLTKRVVRAGTGECPSEGQSVEVHYTGSLADGSVFDSSRSRGKPIDFTLGMGEVIPGWDFGVSSMQVGEAAVLTIPPELGYGSSGAGPIPPNATLTFEVELVSAADPALPASFKYGLPVVALVALGLIIYHLPLLYVAIFGKR